jgi:hypothetical protein
MPISLSITGDETEAQTADEPQDDPDPSVFVLYHAASHVTGNRLGDYLGVPHGRECHDRYDYIIRWGSRTSVDFVPRNTVYNSQNALQRTTDKLESLRMLDEAGVNVPEWTTDRDEISETFGYPALGRSESHTRGQDINLILQWRDAYLTDGNDFFTEYIPTDLEYRMHVVNGEVVKVHEKRLRSEESNHPFIRNSETGWVFVEPRDEAPPDQLAIDAVGSLGLDFGAVDVIREEETGDHYVLEVNSAPSLDEANLERYGERFADELGLSETAGLDAVEWDDEEDSDAESEDSDEGLGEMFG